MTMRRVLIILVFQLLLLAGSAGSSAGAEPAAYRAAVRVGEHPGFSRIVFDFARLPPYRQQRTQDGLTLRFDAAVALDGPEASAKDLRQVADVSWSRENRTFHLALKPGTRARLWESEKHKIVIDLYPPAPQTPAGLQESRPAEAASLHVPGSSDARAEPAGGQRPQPAVAHTTRARPSKSATSAGVDQATERLSALAPAAGPELAISFIRDAEGFALVLTIPKDLGLAAFRRGNLLWLVVERPLALRIDHEAGRREQAESLLSPLTRLERADATILYAALREPRDLSVSERGGRWYVYLKDTTTVPRQPLAPAVDRSAGSVRLFIPVDDPGARVDFTDPQLGDRIIVVPLAGDGQGMLETRRFPQFALLKSAQGIAVQPFDDGLRVRRFANGVAIEADPGLDLSPRMLETVLPSGERPRRLIDLKAWRGDPHIPYPKRESALLVRLSLAPAPQRRQARWDLARFYLGHRMDAEALALLTMIAADSKEAADTPEFHAAEGLALLRLNRPDEALERLLDIRLDPEMEVWLWRALAYERLDMADDAVKAYLKGREALYEQDPDVAVAMRLAAVRAFLALKDWERAEDEITQLDALPLAPRARVETALRRAQLLEGRGDVAAAVKAYQDVARARDRRLSVEARFALVRLQLKTGDITRKEAIEELERLRYAWRGDGLEVRILDHLGTLYRDAGRAREALDTWSIAVSNFPDDPATRTISREMLDLFRHLFLDGAADKMPAVEALGLFYDFRELTPLGADGDRMIRRLARRLVTLGLYDRAAELLDHQVRFRLEGTAQAAVAVPLAAVYLLDDRPEKAVDILRATRLAKLPPALIAERRRIESQALAAMGRPLEAAALLERATDREGVLLRAHYYWQAQDWDRLIATLAPLFAGEGHKGLTEGERRGLLEYALALSLKGEEQALGDLRRRYLGAMGKDALAGLFDLLTAPESPGARELETLGRVMNELGAIAPTSKTALRAEVLAALSDRAFVPAKPAAGSKEGKPARQAGAGPADQSAGAG